MIHHCTQVIIALKKNRKKIKKKKKNMEEIKKNHKLYLFICNFCKISKQKKSNYCGFTEY